MYSQWHRFAGDHRKHIVDDSLLQPGPTSGCDQSSPKLPERVHGRLEAEPIRILAVQMSGLLQQRSNQVVGDDEHQQFFADHIGRLAAKTFHAHRCFDVAKIEFDGPSSEVQLRKLVDGVYVGIEKGRDEIVLPYPKTFYIDEDAHGSNLESIRESSPLGLRPAFLTLRLSPGYNLVVAPESLALPVVDLAHLMGPHHCIGASSQNKRKVRIRGKTSVGENDVVGSK